MSRGRNRGGGGGGGGRGRAQAGTARIAGVTITCDEDLHFDKHHPQPLPLFPPYKVLPPKPLSKDERTQVARYRSLRDRIHEGPLYAVLGDNVRISKTENRANTAAAHFDPFEGMPTYSQRYQRKARKIPKLDTRPYVLKFFPKELWSTLDPSYATTNGVDSRAKSKKLLVAHSKTSNGLSAFDRELSGEPGQGGQADKDEDEEETVKLLEDDEEPPEEEADDQYTSDEDDMAGDYNAEQYFDDGGDDAGEDYDAGEGNDNGYGD
ncbi:hypothetical protein MMC13_002656 [Lambiella insularis]|nr:hypothetical protein [Lambiella insularis]